MKKLFSVNSTFNILVNEAKGLYRLYDFKRPDFVVDAEGNVTDKPFYEPDAETEKWWLDTDDPTQVSEVVNGFYKYTTHKFDISDPLNSGGPYGIKRVNGEKLTEECFYEVGYFCQGLCPVCLGDMIWGCVNEEGELVIPYKFREAPYFNKYGVAYGNESLTDRNGDAIPGTEFNYSDLLYEDQRYVLIALLPDDMTAEIDRCGNAPGITLDIYDTKEREYVARGIPDGKLELGLCDAEKEVVLHVLSMLPDYDCIKIMEKGTIIAKRGDTAEVFDYYA